MEEDLFDDSIFDNSDFEEPTEPTNNNLNKSLLNVSALCCDEELNGYDKLTGQTWIYPTNYPIRDYQFNIIKAAMLENCLVSLPTGLGKTFIAAVIMYNFYRWYPLGKIIFMAPTKPLVAQQIEACYNIVAMPPKDTIEMTGHMQVNTRRTHWQSKRVFFATPQVIYNDIKSGTCPGDKIRCLVIDEAHKAKGNYAYSNIISTLTEMGHFIYRVLALSATPGNKVEDVIHIVKHLHLARLELRTENCLDVKSYSHARNINTVVVELGTELTRLREQYVEILDGYTRKLKNFNIIHNMGNLSKGRIVMMYKEFQNRERGARHPQHNYIMRTFTLLITLYHGLELLVKHGARVFLNFFDEHPEKTWVHYDDGLTSFFDRLREKLGVNPMELDKSVLPDGTILEMPANLNFGHPKFDKLKEIMLKHFDIAKNKGQVTKAIVFCEYRESVNLVYCLLLQCRPMIVPEMFVGHGASGKDGKTVISQKQQLRVMRNFRTGLCNTLVCTCVAEEGLDVGSVDLILCFDVSTRSPIRLVQRCGRTGRERSGQVFILVTEGREHSTLLDCIRQNEGLNQKILTSKEVKKGLFKSNPRMIPKDFTPECQKMFITVAKKETKENSKEIKGKTKKVKEKSKVIKEKAKDKVLKGQKDLRSMLLNKAPSSKSSQPDEKPIECNEMISKEEFDSFFPDGYKESNFFIQPNDCWALKEFLNDCIDSMDSIVKPSPRLEPQKLLQNSYKVKNSSDTKLLMELLQRKELPTTKSPAKKDGDIRVLFSKTTKSIKDYTKSVNELRINSNTNMSNDVLNLLVDLSLENKREKHCYICSVVCKCSEFVKKSDINKFSDMFLYEKPVLPKIDAIDNIKREAIKKLCEEIDINNKKNITKVEENVTRTTDSEPSDTIDLMKDNVKSNASILNIEEHELNYSEDDIFGESDIFDEIDTLIEACDKQIKDCKSIDKVGTESTLHDTVNVQKICNQSKNSVDSKEIVNICDSHSKESFSEITTEINPPTNRMPSLKTVAKSPNRDVNSKNDFKNKSKEANVSEIGNKTYQNNNIIEVEDVFDDDLFYENITPNFTPPSNKLDKEFEKSPILNTPRTNNFDRHNITDSSSEKYDQYDILEVNDIFDDFLTSEKTTKSLSNDEKKAFKSSIQNRKKNVESVIVNSDIQTNENVSIFDDFDRLNDIEISNDKVIERSTFNKTVEETESTVNVWNIEKNILEVLKYFHLDKISDIFQNGNESLQEKKEFTNLKRNDKISLDNLDDVIEVEKEKSYDDNIIEINDDEHNEQFNDVTEIDTSIQDRWSPSLISGRSHTVISSRSTSPILNTQKTKKNLTLKLQTSPILNSQRRNRSAKLNIPINDIETVDLVQDVKPKTQDTEPDHRKTVKLENLQTNSSNIIILDSDDDDFADKQHIDKAVKRKLIEVDCKSPYFKKKPKLDGNVTKPSTIKEKVMAALTSHRKMDATFPNNSQINFVFQSPVQDSTKENKDPYKSQLDMLKNFQYDTKNRSNTVLSEKTLNLSMSDSDDDFVTQEPYKKKITTKLKRKRIQSKTKQVKKASEFLDMEVELSEDANVSADELTDDSTDSIKQFICDDNVTRNSDMHAIYLESIKNPVKGVFKLPQLPPLQKHEVFSQYVEEDNYEMDSFCVDSHIVFNETHEMSELELAEMLLEERRRSRKNRKPLDDTEESIIVKKNFRRVKRQINSDSEDSN